MPKVPAGWHRPQSLSQTSSPAAGRDGTGQDWAADRRASAGHLPRESEERDCDFLRRSITKMEENSNNLSEMKRERDGREPCKAVAGSGGMKLVQVVDYPEGWGVGGGSGVVEVGRGARNIALLLFEFWKSALMRYCGPCREEPGFMWKVVRCRLLCLLLLLLFLSVFLPPFLPLFLLLFLSLFLPLFLPPFLLLFLIFFLSLLLPLFLPPFLLLFLLFFLFFFLLLLLVLQHHHRLLLLFCFSYFFF